MNVKMILKTYTTTITEHIPSGFSMSTIFQYFNVYSIENKHDVYRGKDCMR